MKPLGPIFFKDWLPDQPDFANPGLTEAKNTIVVAGRYESYAPYAGTKTAIASTSSAATTPSCALIAANVHTTTGPSAYVSVPFLGIFQMTLSDWSTTTTPSWTNVAPLTQRGGSLGPGYAGGCIRRRVPLPARLFEADGVPALPDVPIRQAGTHAPRRRPESRPAPHAHE